MHPFEEEANPPYIWYAPTLDVGDGNPVETWPFVSNGVDIVSESTVHPTLDEDYFGTAYHGVVFNGTDLPALDSGNFTTVSSWTFSLFLEITAINDGICDAIRLGDNVWVRFSSDNAVYLRENYTDRGSSSNNSLPLNDPFVLTVVGTVNGSTRTVVVYVTNSSGTTTQILSANWGTESNMQVSSVHIYTDNQYYDDWDGVFGAISFLPRSTSSSEVDSIAEWMFELDPYYLGGGLSRALMIQSAPTGTKVDVRRVAHPARGSIDCTALEDPSGTYFDVTALNGETEVLYRAWYDLDEGSTEPSAGGRTLVPISVATGDTPAEIAEATADALDGTTYLTAFSSGAVAYWTSTDNGEVTAPADGTTGATITELAAGGTDTTQVGYIAATSARTEQIAYLVARPFDVTIGLGHEDFVISFGRYTLTLAGYTAQADSLLQPDFAYDDANDPGWTRGTEWQWTPSTRTLDLNTAGSLDALYFSVKEYLLGDANGLQYEPPLLPVGYDAYRLLGAAAFASGDVANVRRNGFHYVSTAGATTDEWICLQSGVAALEGTAYYTQQIGATPVDAQASGIVDQAVQVYDSGVYDYRSGITLYARPWGKTWGSVSTFDQGITVLRPKTYVCALPPIIDDLNNTTARSTVATWSDVTLTVGATIDGGNPYDLEIDGGGRTVAQVYERAKYITDEAQTATIDGTQGRVYRGQEMLLPYTSGSGTSPEGGTVTGGTSGAVCHVVADHGDALSLRRTSVSHGLGFVAGETLTATGWSATAGTPERYALDACPLCHLEGGTLVGARGVLISHVAGSLRLTDSEGVQHTPPIGTSLAVQCVNVATLQPIADAHVLILAEAGGDYTEGSQLLLDTTDVNGEVAVVLQLSTTQPVGIRVRKTNAQPYYKAAFVTATVVSGDNLTVTVSLTPD